MMTARYNRGLLAPSTITFQYDEFVANPHHAQTRITYDPATDRGADWNYDTALNSPTASAQPAASRVVQGAGMSHSVAVCSPMSGRSVRWAMRSPCFTLSSVPDQTGSSCSTETVPV